MTDFPSRRNGTQLPPPPGASAGTHRRRQSLRRRSVSTHANNRMLPVVLRWRHETSVNRPALYIFSGPNSPPTRRLVLRELCKCFLAVLFDESNSNSGLLRHGISAFSDVRHVSCSLITNANCVVSFKFSHVTSRRFCPTPKRISHVPHDGFLTFCC